MIALECRYFLPDGYFVNILISAALYGYQVVVFWHAGHIHFNTGACSFEVTHYFAGDITNGDAGMVLSGGQLNEKGSGIGVRKDVYAAGC